MKNQSPYLCLSLNCVHPHLCLHKGDCHEYLCSKSESLRDQFNLMPAPEKYFTKEQLKKKAKKEARRKVKLSGNKLFSGNLRSEIKDEDDDLLNDFENVKARKIISIIHSGINRKKNKREKFSFEFRQKVYERDGYACLKCGLNEFLTLDHVKPLYLGGADDFSNLQTLCKSCNEEKGLDVVDYRKEVSLQA